MGDVIRFPGAGGGGRARPSDGGAARALANKIRPLPSLEAFDEAQTRDLLGVCQRVMEASRELVAFVDGDRELARRAGVETIAIEISALLEGNRLEHVLDALEDSVSTGGGGRLMLDGLARLRRAEALLAEARSNMAKYAGRSAGDASPAMGQIPQRDSGDDLVWVPLVAMGIIAIAVILLSGAEKH